MSKKTIQIQEEMSKNFQCLADKYDRLEVWSDFVKLSACRLSISDISKRMREYKGIVSHYSQFSIRFFILMICLQRTSLLWLVLFFVPELPFFCLHIISQRPFREFC